jgi:hypothetical protein
MSSNARMRCASATAWDRQLRNSAQTSVACHGPFGPVNLRSGEACQPPQPPPRLRTAEAGDLIHTRAQHEQLRRPLDGGDPLPEATGPGSVSLDREVWERLGPAPLRARTFFSLDSGAGRESHGGDPSA